MDLQIPGHGLLSLRYLVLDVNGTLAAGGKLVDGVEERLAQLDGVLQVMAVTADTRGTARDLLEPLSVDVRVIAGLEEAQEKRALVEGLGPEMTAVVGNGSNDALMLRSAAVGICVIGREGASRAALESADLVVTDVCDALAMLADPDRLVATLRC